MTILFAAAKLPHSEWSRYPFKERIKLIEAHYETSEWPNLEIRSWFFAEAGVGVFVAYQNHDGKKLRHESKHENTTSFLTHFPFGYRSVVPNAGIDDLPSALAGAVDRDPSSFLRLSPPLGIISVDEAAQEFRFSNDLLGLGKTFLLEKGSSIAISNRPIAAHLLAMIEPEPNDEGWAAEQVHGWFLGDLSPFRNTKRLLGGTTLKVSAGGLVNQRRDLAPRWFTEPARESTFAAFDRFALEFKDFLNPESIDIALSGGRDSRASAALATHYFPDLTRFRTNEPPQLEGILARQLIERLPTFGRFNGLQSVAVTKDERVLWKSNVPKIAEIEVHSRAAEWALKSEGVAASAAIYSNPPRGGVFDKHRHFNPSISGVAGESAKAYYWSPRMSSGAYARNLSAFKSDIKTHIDVRMQTHPLTTQSSFPFISEDYRKNLAQRIREAQQVATANGIHGYRFLDYWWLTDRFGAGTTVGFTGSSTIMPFMVPEYTAEALQGVSIDRAQARFLSSIVGKYRPEWSEVPYFDEIQDKVPPEQVRYYRSQSLLWEGALAPEFMAMLRDSPAFDGPYQRNAIVAFFENVSVAANQKAGLNLKALGLVHRHAFVKMCENVGAVIRNLG